MGKRRPLRYRGVSNARIDSWQSFLNGTWRALKTRRFREAFSVAIAGVRLMLRGLIGG